MITLV